MACRDGANVDARANLALGSLLAGAAFSNAMVGIVHALGHSLGGLCHIPHGQAMMMLLPHCVRYNVENAIHVGLYGELLAHLAPARASAPPASAPAAERDRAFCEHLFSLNESSTASTACCCAYAEMGVERAELEAVAKQARYDGAALYNETEITLEVAWEILEAASACAGASGGPMARRPPGAHTCQADDIPFSKVAGKCPEGNGRPGRIAGKAADAQNGKGVDGSPAPARTTPDQKGFCP